MTQNKLIAVTGGIGSGKSTVINVIKESGYPVLSCDEVCQNLYKKRKVKRKLKTIFPTAVTGKLKLSVDKSEISRICFSDGEKYRTLTDYLTALTFFETLKKAKKYSGKVFVEVPVLFEFEKENVFDGVLVVVRDKSQRIESVKTRSGLSASQIEERMKKQFDYDDADLSPYTVIENNGDLQSLKTKVREILSKI